MVFGSLFGPRDKKTKMPKPNDVEEDMTEEQEFSEPQEILVQGDIQEPILMNFEKFSSEKVPEEYRRLTQLVVSPGPLLGIGSGMDIAILSSQFYMQRLHLLSGPKAHVSSAYMEFDILASATKIILNVARDGTLLQAETRFPIKYGGGRR